MDNNGIITHESDEKAAVRAVIDQQRSFRREKEEIVAVLGGSSADLLTPPTDFRLLRKLDADATTSNSNRSIGPNSQEADEKAAVREVIAQQRSFRREKQDIVAVLGGSAADLLTPSADSRLQGKLDSSANANISNSSIGSITHQQGNSFRNEKEDIIASLGGSATDLALTPSTDSRFSRALYANRTSNSNISLPSLSQQGNSFRNEKGDIMAALGGSAAELALNPSADSRFSRTLDATFTSTSNRSFTSPTQPQSSSFRREKEGIVTALGGSTLELDMTPSEAASRPLQKVNSADTTVNNNHLQQRQEQPRINSLEDPTGHDLAPVSLQNRQDHAQYEAELEATRLQRDHTRRRRYLVVGGVFLLAIGGAIIWAVVAVTGGAKDRGDMSENPSAQNTEQSVCALDRHALFACDPLEDVTVPTCVIDLYSDLEEKYLPPDVPSCDASKMAVIALAVASVSTPVEEQDLFFALATIYFSMGGKNWLFDSAWLEGPSPCSWSRVHCTEDGIGLEFTRNNLVGKLPTEIGLLTSVKYLDFSSNRVFGSIPTHIGLMTSLMNFNATLNPNIEGSLPSEIGNCNLRVLSLLFTHISQIPTEIGKLGNLETFSISGVSSVVPSELGKLSNLRFLTLDSLENDAALFLPEEITNLSNMVRLRLVSKIAPTRPSWFNIGNTIAKMTNLEELNVNRWDLQSSIPTEIGRLSNLMWFGITISGITGSLPTQIGLLTRLKHLRVTNNQLSGSIPTELGLLTMLTTLRLEFNGLTGTLPSTIGQLSQLSGLKISPGFPALTGTIPEEICALDIPLADSRYPLANSNVENTCD